MKNEQIWDNLLNSKEGLDTFNMLMEEAKKEVEFGKIESN